MDGGGIGVKEKRREEWGRKDGITEPSEESSGLTEKGLEEFTGFPGRLSSRDSL